MPEKPMETPDPLELLDFLEGARKHAPLIELMYLQEYPGWCDVFVHLGDLAACVCVQWSPSPRLTVFLDFLERFSHHESAGFHAGQDNRIMVVPLSKEMYYFDLQALTEL